MGMYGNWLRVTPAELAAVHDDLRAGYQRARAVCDAESPTDDRWYCTDKAWHGLEFLLVRQQFPISIVTGEESFVDLPDDLDEAIDMNDDPRYSWGYGLPSYLTVEQVRTAAAALADLTGPALIAGVDQAELLRAEVYPAVWDRPGELEWLAGYVPDVRDYFAAAATVGDAVICWID
jgi:hypothetical protein